MQRQQIYAELKHYIEQRVLEDETVALDEHTPLLEWGILSSFDIVKLLSFIEKQYQLQIPADMIVADHFVHLVAITDMVIESLERARPVV